MFDHSRSPLVRGVIATAVVGVGVAGIAGPAAGLHTASPAQIADVVASRAFDRTKPAIVRIESHRTAVYQVTLPDFSVDKENAFVTSDVRRLIDNGISGPSQGIDNLFRDLANEITAHPDEFFVPGSSTRSQTESETVVGTGVIVSADGLVVTAAQVAPDDAHLVQRLEAAARKDFIAALAAENDGVSADVLSGASSAAPPGTVIDPAPVRAFADAIVNSGTALALKSMKATTPPVPTTVVELGPGVPGVLGPPVALAARVLTATSAPDQSGVSVLKIAGTNLPTATVSSAALLDGEQAVVAGYDADTANGVNLDPNAPVRPSRTQGTIHVAAGQATSVSAPYTAGKVGAPILNSAGAVVGLTATPKTVVGGDAIQAALTQAHVATKANPQSATYQRAVDDYIRHYYRRALPSLVKLHAVNPAFPYVADLITSAKSAVATSKDRTPKGMPIGIVLVAVASNILAAGAVALVARSRTWSRPTFARATGPRPLVVV